MAQERQQRLALAVHRLCRGEHWPAVEGVLMDFLGLLTTELVEYIPQRLDDPHVLRLQAKVKAVTDAFNEFKRLDDIALEIEARKEEGNGG